MPLLRRTAAASGQPPKGPAPASARGVDLLGGRAPMGRPGYRGSHRPPQKGLVAPAMRPWRGPGRRPGRRFALTAGPLPRHQVKERSGPGFRSGAFCCPGPDRADFYPIFYRTGRDASARAGTGRHEQVLGPRRRGWTPWRGGRLVFRPFRTPVTMRLCGQEAGPRVAPWPRIYADLRVAGVRGEEAAEHLLEVVGRG